MELSYPFELPEAIRKQVEERFTRQRRDKYLWEWGGGGFHHPCFYNCVESWHLRPSLIMDAIRLADRHITKTNDDKAHGALCIGLENMEEQLAELEDTLHFLGLTWPHDPIIKAHFNGKGNGEAETAEQAAAEGRISA